MLSFRGVYVFDLGRLKLGFRFVVVRGFRRGERGVVEVYVSDGSVGIWMFVFGGFFAEFYLLSLGRVSL